MHFSPRHQPACALPRARGRCCSERPPQQRRTAPGDEWVISSARLAWQAMARCDFRDGMWTTGYGPRSAERAEVISPVSSRLLLTPHSSQISRYVLLLGIMFWFVSRVAHHSSTWSGTVSSSPSYSRHSGSGSSRIWTAMHAGGFRFYRSCLSDVRRRQWRKTGEWRLTCRIVA